MTIKDLLELIKSYDAEEYELTRWSIYYDDHQIITHPLKKEDVWIDDQQKMVILGSHEDQIGS